MNSENYGPRVTTERSCRDCKACVSEKYYCQGDSGRDVYCAHPAFANEPNARKDIGDTTWNTPAWCPAAGEIA